MTDRDGVPLPSSPTRTCVGCGQRGPKNDLLRLVCGPDSVVRLDVRGDSAGRGAYVHRSRPCLEQVESPRALGRAFRGRARRPDKGTLLDEALALIEKVEVDAGTKEGDVVTTPGPDRSLQ